MEKLSPYNVGNAMATVVHQICDVVDCSPPQAPLGDRQECVLLIEDNEDAMLLVRYALQEYGNGTYRLEWADGLTAGLGRLAKGGVDLVILDLGLPDSSGPASFAAIRHAAPALPVLVLTGDTREQTEHKVVSEGVEDFFVKDDVSGEMLLQAIRAGLYSNPRWLQKKNSAYKQTPRFLWAQEKCQALSVLGERMLKLHRIESAIAAAKAMVAIANHYAESEGALAARADLFAPMERLARAAAAQGLKESSRRFRAMIASPAGADENGRLEFEAAMRQRNEVLDHDPSSWDAEVPLQDSNDLAHVLRQILDSVQT
jgi:DNA-binding response OmpR family regulator